MSMFHPTVIDRIAKQRAERIVDASRSMLRESGIAFEEVEPAHYRLADFDFWPLTGYWRSHDFRAKGYGVGGLIALVKATAGVPA